MTTLRDTSIPEVINLACRIIFFTRPLFAPLPKEKIRIYAKLFHIISPGITNTLLVNSVRLIIKLEKINYLMS